jgi:hypothetical protein
MAEIYNTDCCALSQIHASEYCSLKILKYSIRLVKENGKRAVFVIQKESEPRLAKRLQKLGFNPIATFSRKKCYDSTKLTMWFKSW